MLMINNILNVVCGFQRRCFRYGFRVKWAGDLLFGGDRKENVSSLWGYKLFMYYPNRLIWACQILEIFCDDCYGVHDLPSKPKVIDGGANIGAFALMVKWARPDASLVCIEPDPSNLRYLKKNTSHIDDDCITIIPSVLGRKRGETGLVGEVSDAIHTSQDGERVVEVLPLSELLEEHVDLLKLDVEGDELDALEGAGDALRNVDRVVVECHDYQDRQSPIPEIVTLLHKHGLNRIKIDSHRIIEVSDGRSPIHCCLLHAWRADKF